MNVLSLFDGMSCGRIALECAGIPVTNYFASEIDKSALTASYYNWHNDIRYFGDVINIIANYNEVTNETRILNIDRHVRALVKRVIN